MLNLVEKCVFNMKCSKFTPNSYVDMSIILPPTLPLLRKAAPKMSQTTRASSCCCFYSGFTSSLVEEKRERTPEAVVPHTKTATAVHYCNREQGASSAFSTIFRRNLPASEVRRAP